VLGIVGLQAAMIKNISDSKYRKAAHIAQQTMARCGLIRANLPPVPSPLPLQS
jgi:hypothetical protein